MRTLLWLSFGISVACAQDGATIYKERCASCHDAPTGRTPPFSALRDMAPMKLVSAIETGVMKAQAEGLSSAARYAVVGYIAYPAAKVTPPSTTAFCDPSAPHVRDVRRQWLQWGGDFENTRFQSVEAGGITAADVPKLKLKWAFGLGQTNAARAQPSVDGVQVFVGSEAGFVYSLDARSGCILWAFQADGSVTAAPSIAAAHVYFGDQKANAYALEESTGKLLWKVHLDDH